MKPNKFQPIPFRSLDEFYDSLPETESSIVLALRSLILEALPECLEKLSYNVPFFYKRSRICFIWPASVPWGGLKTGVNLGFSKGYLLDDPEGILEGSDKKEVRSLHFEALADIDRIKILDLLYQADILDH